MAISWGSKCCQQRMPFSDCTRSTRRGFALSQVTDSQHEMSPLSLLGWSLSLKFCFGGCTPSDYLLR